MNHLSGLQAIGAVPDCLVLGPIVTGQGRGNIGLECELNKGDVMVGL